MRLLFDQNLSPRLATNLSDVFPLSVHVSSVGLACALDQEIWDYARGGDLRLSQMMPTSVTYQFCVVPAKGRMAQAGKREDSGNRISYQKPPCLKTRFS